MSARCYRDHGSPVRRARAAARALLPCPDCGTGEEPQLRRPRFLSEAWHRDSSSFFGCAGCGRKLARIEGPAADRTSQVAIDRVPDPEGVIRAMLSHDPAWVRRLPERLASGTSLPLQPVMGPAFAGIEARAGNALPMPLSRGGADPVPVRRFLQLETPLVLVRHAMPWVVWQVEPVAEIVSPAPVSRYRGLSALLEHSSVEAAFVVTIDTTGCWQLSRLRPLRGDGHGAPPRRSSRRY